MLSSYGHLKNILNSAKNLLSNSILYQVIELKKLNNEGCRFNLYKCDGCNKIIEQYGQDSIYVFVCGHKYHLPCATYHNMLVCFACKKNELEESVTNPNIKSRASLIERDFSQVKELKEAQRRKHTLIEQPKKSKNDIKLGKLQLLDNTYLEINSLFG